MKIIDALKKSVVLIYAIIVALLGVCLLIVQNFIDQYCKKYFTLPNLAVFVIDLAVLGIIGFLAIKYGRAIERVLCRFVFKRFVVLLTVLFFLVQTYIARNVYFLTGWDVEVVFNSASSIAGGGVAADWYYVLYPNNLFLTYLFALILKINSGIGLFPENGGVFSIIIFQCALFAVAAYLVFAICYDFTKKKSVSLFAFVAFFLLIGLSPWVIIPYSDAMGLVFPVLMFRIYQLSCRAQSTRARVTLWGVNGLVAFVAFKIKPQLLIMFIAIILIEIFRTGLVRIKDKRLLRRALTNIAVCLLVFVIVAISFSVFCASQTAIMLDGEAEIGLPHFFMMGLNGESNGGYYYNDVEFSLSFDTKAERNAENFRVAFERISEMGFFGLTDHLVRKSLVNFGDGTFAWGVEGNFYREVLPEPNEGVAPFLRSFYYNDGENYRFFEDSMQAVWLAVLMFSGTAGIYAIKHKGSLGLESSVLILSLIGLSLFEALFEARARYLMTYAPIFVICAAIGFYSVLKFIDTKIQKRGMENDTESISGDTVL